MDTRLYRNKPYPINLYLTVIDGVEMLKDIDFVPINIESNINTVLDTLTEREADCIRFYFRDRMTFNEISKVFDISISRANNITAKAIRKLRHPSRLRIISGINNDFDKDFANQNVDIYKSINDIDLPEKTIELLSKEYIFTIKDILSLCVRDIEKVVSTVSLITICAKMTSIGLYLRKDRITPISNSDNILRLDIGSTARMLLRESGINTVGELESTSIKYIRNIPGIRRQFIEEIIQSLKNVGLSLNGCTDINYDQEPVYNVDIDVLDLSARSYNALTRAGIKTINDLMNKSYQQLSCIPNIGTKSLYEITNALKRYELKVEVK